MAKKLQELRGKSAVKQEQDLFFHHSPKKALHSLEKADIVPISSWNRLKTSLLNVFLE
ncbi:hypothetical protein [Vibrio thalassae]|uniref:hypothetical protein n=1 Tax=Vibrio thalassae TaxID=1243014 RepID=UPI0013053361|nr:hypothetical protein [Vibrio thalassae]